MAKFNDNIILQGGAEFRNLKITSTVDADIIGVIRSIFNSGGTEVTDIECCADGTNWFSLRGYKAQNTYEEVGGNIPILDGLSSDGKSYKFRVLKAGGEAGSEYISITNNNGIITIDLSNGFKDRIDDIETALLGKVSNEFKTGSESIYKVLSDNNFTDLLLAKLSTIQIKKDVAGNGKYYLAFNDGTTDHQLGADIPLDSVINSGSVKTCTTVDVPVNGYKVGDKYIDFTIANSTEHVYILVSDLIDIMYGFAADEITTTIESGNKIKAEINSNSIDITKLKKVVLGTITKTNSLISEINEYTLKEAIIVLACNIKDLYDRKADKNQTIISPTADSDQITANTYDLTTILQKSLNNINYLFTNKANSNHNHEGVYLKPADIIDNITSTDINKPLSANQGKVLGALIGERIKGVKVDGIELTPDVNKVVEVPIMQGASASTNGKAGLVPKPLSGQQASFLRGDGSYGQPNADTIASASYIGDVTPVMNGGTFVNNSGNIVITLTNTYVSKTLFPAAVDIVRVIRNGLELAEGEDFTIASGGSNVITLVGYTLYDDDIILVKYKTSIGAYGSVFQNAVDNAIIITSQANEAAQRAEEAAIDAENIANSKIDKTAIAQELGTSPTDVMSQKAITEAINSLNLTASIPLSAGQYYTLNTAILAVPTTLKKVGMEITFESSLGVWESFKFHGKISDFLFNDRWVNSKDNFYPIKNYLTMDNYTNGKYINKSTGVETTLADFGYFTLSIKGGAFYYVNWNIGANQTGAYFDINNNYISAIDYSANCAIHSGNKWYLKTPPNATTIKLNILNNDIYINSFVKDITPIIYKSNEIDIYTFPNIINLLNFPSANLFNFGFIHSTGVFSLGNYGMTLPIKVQENDVIRVTNWVENGFTPSGYSSRGVVLNSDMQILSQLEVSDNYTPEYIMPANAAFVCVVYPNAKINEIKIEKIHTSVARQISDETLYSASLWNNKKWVSLGDSLTYRNTWQPKIAQHYKLIHTNCGIGSTLLAGNSPNAFWQDVRLNAVKAADPDVVTILGGANDITQDIPIGTDAEFDLALANKDKLNFKGAYSYIVENLLTWKPTLKIIILTTSFAHNGGGAYSPSGTMRYYMYADASREVAQHYGLVVVDLYREMGLNKLTQNIYTTDTIHWNEQGSESVSSLVKLAFNKLKNI